MEMEMEMEVRDIVILNIFHIDMILSTLCLFQFHTIGLVPIRMLSLSYITIIFSFPSQYCETLVTLPTMKSQITFFQTSLNGLNLLCGVGLLSIPFALSQGGWTSIIILFIVASVSWYMGLFLHRCMKINPRIKTYPDIGASAFGNSGRVLVSVLVYFELYLLAVEFLILGGDGLQKLFPTSGFKIGSLRIDGRKMYMLLTALVILPTTWLRSMGALTYISFVGILTSFILIVCVVWSGLVDGVGFHHKDDVIFKFEGLPTPISLFTFCYCAHAVFPTLRSSMKNKAHFPKVLLVSFVISTLNYGSMAILGYLMYGANIEEQIILNLPQHKINTKIAIFTTLINLLAKYASIINPIAQAIEDASPLRATRMSSMIIRTLLLLTTLIVAMAIPIFAYVMAFVGAFPSVTNSILIACFCYLKINAGRWELVLILLIIVMGLCVGLVGTYSSINFVDYSDGVMCWVSRYVFFYQRSCVNFVDYSDGVFC